MVNGNVSRQKVGKSHGWRTVGDGVGAAVGDCVTNVSLHGSSMHMIPGWCRSCSGGSHSSKQPAAVVSAQKKKLYGSSASWQQHAPSSPTGVGAGEGDTDGDVTGASVGPVVGAPAGDAVGDAVGSVVGDAVGSPGVSGARVG